MRVRITRKWQMRDIPQARLEVGQVFDVCGSVAIYLLALGCAELVPEAPAKEGASPRT